MKGKKYLIGKVISVLLFAFFVIIIGCRQKEQTPVKKTNKEYKADSQAVKQEQVNKTDSIAAEKKEMIPDLTGTWTGKFDKRSTTLKITEQNGSEFQGKITINYREVINQKISGSIDPKTSIVKMKDLLHSRFQGKYNGKLSDANKKIDGTFTMDLDGSKFQFSLKKK